MLPGIALLAQNRISIVISKSADTLNGVGFFLVDLQLGVRL